MPPGRSSSMRANAAAQAAPLLAGYGLNLLLTPLMVSTLGLRAFGIWAMTGALAQYGAIFDLGVSRSVMRFVAFHHERADAEAEREVVGVAMTILLGVAAVLAVLVAAVAGPVRALIPAADDAEMRVLLLSAVGVMALLLAAKVLTAAAFGRGRMVAGSLAMACQTALSAASGGAYLVLAASPALAGFALATVAGAATGLVVVAGVMLATERSLSVGLPTCERTREVVGFGLKGQVSLVADLIVFQSDKLVIGAVAGPAFAGAYELANRVAIGLRAIGAIVSNTLTPSLTAAYSAHGLPGVLAVYESTTRRAIAVSVALPLFGVAVAPAIIPAWLGETPGWTVAILVGLGLAFAANLATGVATVVAMAIGRPGIVARSAIISALINLVAVVPGALIFGVGGVLGATILASVGGAVVGIWITHSAIGLPRSVYLRAVGAPLAAGVSCAAGTCAVLLLAGPEGRPSGIVWLMFGSALFAVSYGAIGLGNGFLPGLRAGQRRAAT